MLCSSGQLSVARRVDREELLCGRLPQAVARDCCRADFDECVLTLNVRVACVGPSAAAAAGVPPLVRLVASAPLVL